MTGKYETMLVFSVKNGDEAAQAMLEKFKALIESNGTLDGEVDDWGRRKLAYPINYESEGWYAVYTYDSAPDFPAELERVVHITDGVLRAMTVKKA